ncbi:hypothetical protein GCM10007392_02130 [Saccharospirillum salsuginis]|uniref:Outer membrane protein beta-barrel domain-containing protein n=2 Tax=Saccharospirillum salsuginis TaxID=418750 RepID=A0A918K146_9GAMM|nr:hypothetical protein GCM10007392_02130 [Saccharospirillum salsuginis]
MIPRMITVLGLMVATAPAWAVEWQQARFSIGTGPLFASLQSQDDYPSAPGLGIQGDYQVPVFVEGHTRAYVRGALNWAQHKPDIEDDQHGTTAYGLTATAGLLHDLKLGNRLIWIGGGAGLGSLSQVNHYSWHQDGNSWTQTEYETRHDPTVVLEGSLQIPIQERLFIDLSVDWPVIKPALLTTRLSVNFKLN